MALWLFFVWRLPGSRSWVLVIGFGVGGPSAIVWTQIIPLHQTAHQPSFPALWQAHPEEVMIPIKEWTDVEIELAAFFPAPKMLFWICGQQLAVVFFFLQRKGTVCIVPLVAGSKLIVRRGFQCRPSHGEPCRAQTGTMCWNHTRSNFPLHLLIGGLCSLQNLDYGVFKACSNLEN